MTNKELLLIYPPLSVHEFPHMALPLLKGFLESNGIDACIKDFNVEIMGNIVKNGFGKVEKYYHDKGIRLNSKEVERNFKIAREILLENERGKDEWAFKLINTYLKLAGANISDSCFSPSSFNDIKEKYLDYSNGNDKVADYVNSKVIPELKRNPAEVIGISVPFGSQIYYSLIIGREIKRNFKDTKVIIGGSQISLFWKTISGFKPFKEAYDVLVYGNGENAILEYTKYHRDTERIKFIPNLIYYEETTGKHIVNPEASTIQANLIPVPDFDGLPLDEYAYPKLPYFLSRGCYWSKCRFCSYRDVKGYSARDTNHIIQDIVTMKDKYKRRFFHFIDDAIHPFQMKDIADKLIHENIKIKYEAYFRLDSRFTKECCTLIAKSGLRSALFGLESGNERILKLMNKGICLKEALVILENMKNAGIQSVISCLIGFPTETKQEAWDSIEFLKSHMDLYTQAFLVHYGLISDMIYDLKNYNVDSVKLDNPIRYDDTGFIALGYEYKANIGMTNSEALEVIKLGRDYLGIEMYNDCFFS